MLNMMLNMVVVTQIFKHVAIILLNMMVVTQFVKNVLRFVVVLHQMKVVLHQIMISKWPSGAILVEIFETNIVQTIFVDIEEGLGCFEGHFTAIEWRPRKTISGFPIQNGLKWPQKQTRPAGLMLRWLAKPTKGPLAGHGHPALAMALARKRI